MEGFKAKQFIPCRYNRCMVVSPTSGRPRKSRMRLRIMDDAGRYLERPVYECERPECPASRYGSDAPIYVNMVGKYAHEHDRQPRGKLKDGDKPDKEFMETAV